MISAQKDNTTTLTSIDSWKANLRIYMRIIALLRPHWLSSTGAVICLGLSTGFALVVPWLLAWVIDKGFQHGQVGPLLLAAAAILATSALRGLFAYGQGYLSQAVSNLVAYDLRDRLYDHLQSLSFSFHDEAETGQLMSRLTVDIEAVRNFIPLGLLRGLLALVTFVAITIILFQLDWHLALVTMICIPILAVLATQVARRLRPMWLSVQNEAGALGTIMQESLSGMRVVKAFAREEFETTKFDTKNRELRELNLGAMRLSAWNQPLMVLVLNIITVLIVWIGGVAITGHQLSLGKLVAVTQYILLLATPVRTFGFMITWFMRGLSGGTRIFGVLDTQPTITDANIILGYMNPQYLVGGALRLNADKAQHVFEEQIAQPLGLSLAHAAYGAHQIAASNMMRAIRAVSTERGRDPRDYALFAFGGNGPLFAAGLFNEGSYFLAV